MLGVLDRLLQAQISVLRWLSLPLAALLFLQWPLRDWVQAYSRDANDLGQWLFALFVATSVIAATRARHHIATDVVAARYRPFTKALLSRIAILLGVLPWALFVLWTAAPQISRSFSLIERFPDTGNPGYFIIRLALGLLAFSVIIQAVIDYIRVDERTPDEHP